MIFQYHFQPVNGKVNPKPNNVSKTPIANNLLPPEENFLCCSYDEKSSVFDGA